MAVTTLVFEEVVEGATGGETLVLSVWSLGALKKGHERRVEMELPHGLQFERVVVHLREHEC